MRKVSVREFEARARAYRPSHMVRKYLRGLDKVPGGLVIDTPSQTGGWNWKPVPSAGVNSILHDSQHRSSIVFGTVRGARAPAGYPPCDTLLNQPCRPDAF